MTPRRKNMKPYLKKAKIVLTVLTICAIVFYAIYSVRVYDDLDAHKASYDSAIQYATTYIAEHYEPELSADEIYIMQHVDGHYYYLVNSEDKLIGTPIQYEDPKLNSYINEATRSRSLINMDKMRISVLTMIAILIVIEGITAIIYAALKIIMRVQPALWLALNRKK